MPSVFDTRFVGYVPGGAKITDPVLVTALTATVNIPYSDSPTISIPVSTAIYGQIPTYFEVALEWYNGTAWVEAYGCRFIINTAGSDESDVTGTITLTGVQIWHWFLNKTFLNHVSAYTATGISASSGYAPSGISSVGTTFTKASHNFEAGDRVQVTDRSGSTGVQLKGYYYIRNVTTNTFQLAGSKGGTPRTVGTHSNYTLARLPKKLTKSGHNFLNGQKVTMIATGGAVGVSAKQDYYIRDATSTTFCLAAKVNGPAITVGSATNMQLRRALDGDRRFNAQTPGAILKKMIDESQARGELSPGAVPLAYSFTSTLDSAGVAWPKTFTIGISPGTSGLNVLQMLADKGWIEFSTTGRTLNVYPAGHGTDLSVGILSTSIGASADARAVKSTLDNMLTNIVTVGDNGKLLHQSTSVGSKPLGELGSYQTQPGISDDGTSQAIVDRTINKTAAPDTQRTVTELAAAAAALPFRDYLPGDTVRVRMGDTWSPLNVAEVQLRIDTTGQVTIDTILGYRFTGLLSKVARKARFYAGGRPDSGNGSGKSPFLDTIQPTPPGNITPTTAGVFQAGRAKSAIALSWDPVTTDDFGNAVDVTDYEVWLRADSTEDAVLAGVTGGAVTFTVPASDSQTYYYASVRAQSATGQWGGFSDEVEVVTAAPTDVLDAPTTPVLSSKVGTLVVKWDGNLVASDASLYTPPLSFDHVYAEIATSSGGTYSPIAQHLRALGSAELSDRTVGTTYWVRLVAVDALGVESARSPSASIAIAGVDLASMAVDVTTAINNAQNSADGKNKIVYTTTAPASIVGYLPGDTVFVYSGTSGNVTAHYTLMAGTPNVWVSRTLDNTAIANLDAGKITTGYLAASRIQAGTINVSQLLVGDFTNYVLDGDFENVENDPNKSVRYTSGPGNWWDYAVPVGTVMDRSTTVFHSGSKSRHFFWSGPAGVPLDTTFSSSMTLPLSPDSLPLMAGGSTIYYEYWERHDSGTSFAPSTLMFQFFNSAGGNSTQAATQTAISGGTWVKRSGFVNAPSDAARLYIQIQMDNAYPSGVNVYWDDFLVQRKNTGSIILDGTMAATAIQAGTITTTQLSTGVSQSIASVGDVKEGCWTVAPTGWLLMDGTAVSRVTYSALFAVLAPSLGTATVTVATPAVVTKTAHGLPAGSKVYFTTTGALPTGLTANTIYYVSATGIATNTFQVSASLGGASIATTGTQSGVHTLVVCPYGLGDGSTTFNLPDARGMVLAGMKAADTNFGVLGIPGGAATHSHALSDNGQAQVTISAGGPVYVRRITTASYNSTQSGGGTGGTTVSTALSTGAALTGTTDAGSTLPPYLTINRAIKY